MRWMIALGALALCACAPSVPVRPEPPAPPPPAVASADQAGNRLEAMAENAGALCSQDGQWCVIAGSEAGEPATLQHRGEGARRDYVVGPRERATARAWPFIVRLVDPAANEPVLMGVLWETMDGYSGGGASETVLTLYTLGQGAATPVLEALYSGDVLIRACFSEADTRTRLGACHDEYVFAAALTLDQDNASGPPRFLYQSRAATYPGRVSRTQDAAERGALSAGDLVWSADETCSVTRAFRWTGAAYEPDTALPACEDYRTQ